MHAIRILFHHMMTSYFKKTGMPVNRVLALQCSKFLKRPSLYGHASQHFQRSLSILYWCITFFVGLIWFALFSW